MSLDKIYNVIIDLINDSKNKVPQITFNKNDRLTSIIAVKLNADGVAVELTDKTIDIYIKKPDDKKIFNSMHVVDAAEGILYIELPTQALTAAGACTVELRIQESEEVRIPASFSYNVIDSIIDDSAIESSNDFSALTDKIKEVDRIIEQGITGIKGDKGDRGEKGEAFKYEDFTPEQLATLRGDRGEQGLKGDAGARGEQGLKGDRGDTGAAGINGSKGEKGDTGLTPEEKDFLFQSVSSGKTNIAAAITDKGIETAADTPFDIMATNIRAIESNSGGIEINGAVNITDVALESIKKGDIVESATYATMVDKLNTSFEENDLYAIKMSPDNSFFVTLKYDGIKVYFYNESTGIYEKTFSDDSFYGYASPEVSNNKIFVMSTSTPYLRAFNVNNKTLTVIDVDIDIPNFSYVEGVFALALSPDGKYLSSCCDSYYPILYKVSDTGLTKLPNPVNSACYLNSGIWITDNKLLSVQSSNASIFEINSETDETLVSNYILSMYAGGVNSICKISDSRYITSDGGNYVGLIKVTSDNVELEEILPIQITKMNSLKSDSVIGISDMSLTKRCIYFQFKNNKLIYDNVKISNLTQNTSYIYNVIAFTGTDNFALEMYPYTNNNNAHMPIYKIDEGVKLVSKDIEDIGLRKAIGISLNNADVNSNITFASIIRS